MALEETLQNREFDKTDLTQIYTLFCDTFGIEQTPKEIKRFGQVAWNHFIDGHLDWRPYMGAKFFGSKHGNFVRFHGYSVPQDSQQTEKDKHFQEVAKAYLSQGRLF